MQPLTGVATENMGIFLLCKAFADGCSAMTGTEAVANGVPAFKPVEWKNAQQTMIIMATLLGIMFLGTSYLAIQVGAHPAGVPGRRRERALADRPDGLRGRARCTTSSSSRRWGS